MCFICLFILEKIVLVCRFWILYKVTKTQHKAKCCFECVSRTLGDGWQTREEIRFNYILSSGSSPNTIWTAYYLLKLLVKHFFVDICFINFKWLQFLYISFKKKNPFYSRFVMLTLRKNELLNKFVKLDISENWFNRHDLPRTEESSLWTVVIV